MKIKTKDILAYLQLDQNHKNKLLDLLNSPDADRKLAVVDILWEAFDQLYELRFQENLRAAIQRVNDSGESVGEDFYKKVEEETKKEFEKEMAKKTTDYDLSSVREKLQQFMNHDSASKPDKVN